MTAANKLPLFTSNNNRTHPVFVSLPVQAGATQAIKQGEICKIRSTDFSANPIIPVSADDSGFFPVIAWEEQAAGDAARLLKFAVPMPGDFFEYSLNAATSVGFGDGIELAGSQTVKVGTSNVVATTVGAYTEAGAERSVTKINVEFLRVAADGLENFPFLNTPQQAGS